MRFIYLLQLYKILSYLLQVYWQKIFNHLGVFDVAEAHIEASEGEGVSVMIKVHEMQDSGVELADRLIDYIITKFIGLAVNYLFSLRTYPLGS